MDEFIRLATQKGHSYVFDEPIKYKKRETVKYNVTKIIEAEDINMNRFSELKQKQKTATAKESEKYETEKHRLKLLYGVDKLNEEIMKIDQKEFINFMHLLDDANIKELSDDSINSKTIKERINIVHKVIKDLGFNNIADNKVIKCGDLETAIKNMITNNELFNNYKKMQVLFTLDKRAKAFDESMSLKSSLGYINSILNMYSIGVVYSGRIGTGDKRIAVYKLEYLNDVPELINNKLNKNHTVHDKHDLIKLLPKSKNVYADLIIKNDN